jgi:hypothetical protein
MIASNALQMPFFFATLEEYYLDKMILPAINGPSEGILIGVAIGTRRHSLQPKIMKARITVQAFSRAYTGPASGANQ